MLDWKKNVDPKYNKASLYVIITCVAVFILCSLLKFSSGFFKQIVVVIGLVLRPFILGDIIAYLFSPLINWIERKLKCKGARVIAVIGTLIVIVLIVVALLFALLVFLNRTISGIHFEDLGEMIGAYTGELNDLGSKVQNWLMEHNINIGSITGTLTGTVTGMISGIAGFASDLLFTVIFAIYFLLDGENIKKYWQRVERIFFKPETSAKLYEILQDADKCFSGYIRGQLVDALLVGVMTLIAMTICGVPYPFVIALLTGFGNLIPNFGPILGMGSLIAVCILQGTYDKLLIGGIVLIILMTVDGQIINPKLLSSNIEIHPLLVFAAMIAGSAVGGLVGMLVSVPLAALLKVEFEKYLDKKEAEQLALSAKQK